MQNLTGRQFNILKHAIDIYIETAEPVSSKLLAKKYYPELSPATIRNEFQILEKNGYIYQPHVSAGRLPTDLGLKTLASSLFEQLDREVENFRKDFLENFNKKSDYFWGDLVEKISDITDSFAALSLENQFYHYGISELFSHIASAEPDDFIEIAENIENLENNFYQWKERLNICRPAIFIGKESPITSNKNISVIVNKIPCGRKNAFSIIIGPKRMKYEKNLAIIKSIEELF